MICSYLWWWISTRTTVFSLICEEKWVFVSSGYAKVGEIDKCSSDHFPITLSWAASVWTSQRNKFHCYRKLLWCMGSSVEKIQLTDRLDKDIRLQPLHTNILGSLIYSRNLIEGKLSLNHLKFSLYSYVLYVIYSSVMFKH